MKTLPLLDMPPATDRAAVAAFYQEHGYYIARRAVAPAALAGLTADFDRIVAQMERTGENANARWDLDTTTDLDADRGSVVIHTHQVQKYSAAWARFCFSDALLDPCETLVGPDIVLHHTKLFLKPAGKGAAFPPHQDHGYFPTTGDSMFAAVVYLTPSNEENGCVRVWPGTHKLGPIPNGMGASKEVAARFPISDSVPAICEPGDILYFNYLTVHGSLANRGTQPRKSVLLQLHSGRDIMPGGGHPSSNLVLRGWHHEMTRQRADAS